MSLNATIRGMVAAERQQQREAKKRQRDLERQAKEMAKLSALEQARLEVETYENALEVLLSVHKEQAAPWDWPDLANSLSPVPPRRHSHNELKARQLLAFSASQQEATVTVQQAQQKDEREYQEALQTHAVEYAEWGKFSNLAHRILEGDSGAYIEAIQELSPFTELAGIGSSLHFTVHNARVLECIFSTNGNRAIPAEIKALTASGKVTVKTMPRTRFVEIYQDYVCGCILRVARELFALLPVDTLLITASAEALDTSTGQRAERPFLSVAIPRGTLKSFNFDELDPSDSVMSLTHRGDLKASRKTGDFEFINPLTVSDLAQETSERTDFHTILAAAQSIRAELEKQCADLNPQAEDVLSTNGET
jgi:hypothetical protein